LLSARLFVIVNRNKTTWRIFIMFCNQCGVQLPENSVACYRCGNQLTKTIQPVQPVVTKPIIVKQSSGLGIVVFMTILFGGILFIGVVGFLGYQKYQDDKTIFGFEIRNDGFKVKVPSSYPSAPITTITPVKTPQIQPPINIKRFTLKQDDTSISISGLIQHHTSDDYVFEAKEGQVFSVGVSGNVRISIKDAEGNILCDDGAGFSGNLISSGDQYISVYSNANTTDYRLSLSLTEKDF
jgi:hypothetical protein